MKDEYETTSTSSSELIKQSLNKVHKITKTGMENSSSVLKCLQDKVNELRVFQEKYYEIEAQLKSANDALKFQEAEYTFRESELQIEINTLKQIEVNLREQISRNEIELSKMSRTFDVYVKLEIENKKLQQDINDQTEELSKLQKLVNEKDQQIQHEKEKVKTIAQRFKKLHEVYDDLKAKNQSFQDESYKKAKESKKKHTDTINRIQSEKNKQEDIIREMKNHEEKQKAKINSLSDENEKKDEIIHSLQEEKEKQKRQLKEIKMQNNKHDLKLQEILRNNQQIKSSLDHIETERDSLYDLLNVDPEDIKGTWTNLFDRCRQLMIESRQNSELQKCIEKLKKRLSLAIEENKKVLSQTKPENDYDELVDNLRVNLHRSECEIGVLNKQLQKMAIRNKFATLIDRQTAKFSRQLNELHEYVFETDNSQIRSLILAVVFTKRLLRVFRGESVVDIHALQVFKGRNSASLDLKLRDLRDKFVQFTEDLLVAKQNWIDSEKQKKEYENHLKFVNKKLDFSSNGIENNTKQILLLKNRVLELQQELSSLVSPEQYDEMKQRAERAEKAELEALAEKHSRNENFDEYDINHENNRRSSQVESSIRIEEIKNLKSALLENQKEIDSLRILLNEKTKEILSLERLVSRHKEVEKTQTNNFTCISAENKILNECSQTTRIYEPEPVTLFTGKTYGLSMRINPAFLGQ
ncbi:hypothetical protein TRFO_39869 [Tritrichomonas foetus]|uniref:Uncharacterized protein n=1 Tax=Tritrichomonas foetus TaxID=1144522 RepID=A0A1J4J8C3_9EUKA|nr:hypothetical protein TRFO_39869 [Tritrichomonas foetus]|eukprot:OHS93939.1 hypothetical protein TRFO_39869 [Tritrichomonas foetus]